MRDYTYIEIKYQLGVMMPTQEYQIGNLDCANCARELQEGVSHLGGVEVATVDFAKLRLIVEGNVSEAVLRQRVEAFGHTLENDNSQENPTQQTAAEMGGVAGFGQYLLTRNDTRMALIGAAFITGGIIAWLIGAPHLLRDALYGIALAVAVIPVAKSGLNALRINRKMSINLLMTIAAIGAFAIGEYLEAALVIFLYTMGEALEGYITNRARDSLKALLAIKPNEAHLLKDNQTTTVPVEQLAIGDTIVVKAGERVPMDGTISNGASSLNQAPITGESIPVDKSVGDTIFAGSINTHGTLEIEVTHSAEDNTLSRIITMVEEAQSSRAPSQRLVDQFAEYYTPLVVLLAALVAIVPPLLFGASAQVWVYRALTMLVIACPCALVISTPVTVIAAITAAARQGVLIKGGAHLEALGTVKAIAFDKTGTLTQGRPQVTQVKSLACNGDASCNNCDDLVALAAAVESRSTHPIAQAIVQEAAQRDVLSRYAQADNVQTLSGRGVQGMVDGQQVTIGSHRYFDAEFQHNGDLCATVREAEANGNTTMLLHDGDSVRGYIAVADTVRERSKQVVQSLHQLNIATVMLTGDNDLVAQAVGDDVGVSDVRSSLMPEDKVGAVEKLLQQRGSVAMVGDGVNDTPALAAATVGIAMGGAGTAQALETADIALMADDIGRLPYAVKLARFARRLILQNVGLSIALKVAFLALAMFGTVTMWVAIFVDVGMMLIVTLNGMRPLRFKA